MLFTTIKPLRYIRAYLFSFLFFFTHISQAITVPSALVDTEWLSNHLDEVLVLDVRKDLKSFETEGHIYGAILVNAKKVRTTREVNGIELTRMTPIQSVFENYLSDHGVSSNSTVVITHQGHTPGDVAGAARLYWQMKYYGFDNVAMLNGGNAQWVKHMEELVTNPTKVKPAVLKLDSGNDKILATMKEVKDAIGNDTALVDTRNLRFHVGLEKRSYVYDFGHIPSSKLFPYKFLHPSKGPMIFPIKEQINQRFKSLGIDPNQSIILYCNSAYECSSVWFSLHEIFGNPNVKVYDGSLHEWTQYTKNPMTKRLSE